jgi:hypothetical protein
MIRSQPLHKTVSPAHPLYGIFYRWHLEIRKNTVNFKILNQIDDSVSESWKGVGMG